MDVFKGEGNAVIAAGQWSELHAEGNAAHAQSLQVNGAVEVDEIGGVVAQQLPGGAGGMMV